MGFVQVQNTGFGYKLQSSNERLTRPTSVMKILTITSTWDCYFDRTPIPQSFLEIIFISIDLWMSLIFSLRVPLEINFS